MPLKIDIKIVADTKEEIIEELKQIILECKIQGEGCNWLSTIGKSNNGLSEFDFSRFTLNEKDKLDSNFIEWLNRHNYDSRY